MGDLSSHDGFAGLTVLRFFKTSYLWEHLSNQPIQFEQEVELPATAKRLTRTTKLAVRFCPVQLRSPKRLDNHEPLKVYAVYAKEIDPPLGEEAVSWMLLTTEAVTNSADAAKILRWYTYRWHIEEYHKILKSGCQAESYRLAAKHKDIKKRRTVYGRSLVTQRVCWIDGSPFF